MPKYHSYCLNLIKLQLKIESNRSIKSKIKKLALAVLNTGLKPWPTCKSGSWSIQPTQHPPNVNFVVFGDGWKQLNNCCLTILQKDSPPTLADWCNNSVLNTNQCSVTIWLDAVYMQSANKTQRLHDVSTSVCILSYFWLCRSQSLHKLCTQFRIAAFQANPKQTQYTANTWI